MSTPAAMPGSTSATTWDIRRFVPISIPLARLTTASSEPADERTPVSTSRNPCDGTAMNTMPVPASASSNDEVTASPSGSSMPGR